MIPFHIPAFYLMVHLSLSTFSNFAPNLHCRSTAYLNGNFIVEVHTFMNDIKPYCAYSVLNRMQTVKLFLLMAIEC